MSLLEEILHPISPAEFKEKYLFKQPFALPRRALRFRRAVNWELLEEILSNHHQDSWLPRRGQLPTEAELATGTLTMFQAQKSFTEGRTILIRHAEKSSQSMSQLAELFKNEFNKPIDIQLYCTPAGEEGFDWHYDSEDVFVIQSAGTKEFRLRANTKPRHELKIPCHIPAFPAEASHTETRCLLQPGDWLYIPAGCWHKAMALSPSFHISVGVSFLV